MVVKSLKCSFTLFSYSNLSDQLLDLYCVYIVYIVEHYLSPDI